MNTIFTIEPQFATLLKEEGIQITFEHSVPRADFLSQFSGIDASDVRQLSYEPHRGLFHIVDVDYNLTALSTASDDARMQFVADNIGSITSWFESKYAEQQQDEA